MESIVMTPRQTQRIIWRDFYDHGEATSEHQVRLSLLHCILVVSVAFYSYRYNSTIDRFVRKCHSSLARSLRQIMSK